MQQTEHDEKQRQVLPADPESQPLQSVIAQVIENDDDPTHLMPAEADEIFKLAEAEIQPLLRKMRRERWTGRVQAAFCLCMMLTGIIGIVYEAINYPKTTVTLFPVERPVTLTTVLNVPLRTLAPVTLTRSATMQTTGKGHQDAQNATGTVIYFNGSFAPQTVSAGTVYTGADGVQIVTDQAVTIAAASPGNPPQFGQASIPAHAIQVGAKGNIPSGDITIIGNTLQVRNAQFTNGRDARDYRAVAPSDIQNVTSSTTQLLNQQIPQAFSLRPGEALHTTTCATKTTADHAPGDEAQTVTVQTIKTCSAVAYSQEAMTSQAIAAYTTKARPAGYQLLGSVQTSVTSVTPFTVRLTGSWVFVVSKAYEQHLAEQIAGETPAKAKAYLLSTGVIAQAGIPSTLPQEMYIQFVVIVGL
jgi:hypothetical protein